MAFVRTARDFSPLPVMLQIDGAPMSGTEHPEASRPALEAALDVMRLFESAGQSLPPLTISGGINHHTADHLQTSCFQNIAGVGMGTVARRHVWALPDEAAIRAARGMVKAFKTQAGRECAII
jgi:hypothetical protein